MTADGENHCARCDKETLATIMSMFNTDTLCLECKALEKAHPDYEKARDAESEQVRKGNYYFHGIGLPADLS